ncbi:hypothetical protein NMD1_04097 [Novosphingobium sp. MD-1]|nr:hypothetical protein NMD1_04097 [Novosphingobium sp. MD-1]
MVVRGAKLTLQLGVREKNKPVIWIPIKLPIGRLFAMQCR